MLHTSGTDGKKLVTPYDSFFKPKKKKSLFSSLSLSLSFAYFYKSSPFFCLERDKERFPIRTIKSYCLVSWFTFKINKSTSNIFGIKVVERHPWESMCVFKNASPIINWDVHATFFLYFFFAVRFNCVFFYQFYDPLIRSIVRNICFWP